MANESREVALAREIYAMEQQASVLAKQAKLLKERYDLKAAELQDYLIEEGKTSTGHIEGVGVFAIKRDNMPSVTQEHMPLFLQHLRDNEDEGIIVETVPAPSLKKYCKDELAKLTEDMVEDPELAEKLHAEARAEVLPVLHDRRERFIRDERSTKRVDEQIAELESELLPPAKIAAYHMMRYGVDTFQQIKLSHTQKGK